MPFTDKPQQVLSEISPKSKPYPIYVLMGEETYYIDQIEQKLTRTFLPEEESHDFNLTVLYGLDTQVSSVLNACMRPPMGTAHTITVVREAQDLYLGNRGSRKEGETPFDSLAPLYKNPSPFNILILCFKGKSPARTLKVMKEIEKVGLVISSPEIKEYNIQNYIPSIASEHGLSLGYDAVMTVKEHLGNDIGRINSEFRKLVTALPAEARKNVSSEMILKYTALNKEYSPFDLKNALALKDRARALKVARALSLDAKRVPVQVIIPILFNYFANLLIALYARSLDPKVISDYLGLKFPRQAQEYVNGLRNYRPGKITAIISYLRKMDARSKGMYSDEGDPREILTDLVLFVLN